MIEYRRLRNYIRITISASFVSIFIGGPQLSLGPANIRIFDIIFLLLISLASPFLIRDEIAIPRFRLGLIVCVTYFVSVILLPIYGIAIYDFPIGYFLGDIRWIQLFLVTIIVLYFYRGFTEQFISEIEKGMKIVLALNLIFVILQFLVWSNTIDVSYLLEVWYSNRPRYEALGFDTGRFAGAHSYSSQLGLSAIVGITIFIRSFLWNRKNIVWLFVSIILLIASGHRTSVVAAGGVIAAYTLGLLLNRNSGGVGLRELALSIITTVPFGAVAYILNIGRIRSSDRYMLVFRILSGEVSFLQASGRGPLWTAAFQEAAKYPFGTLAVPSHVLGTTIDSYFVVAYAQGGILLLAIYLSFLVTIAYYSLNIVYFDNIALIPVGLVVISTTHSLTQNFATGLQGKFVLLLSVMLVSLVYLRHSKESSKDGCTRK